MDLTTSAAKFQIPLRNIVLVCTIITIALAALRFVAFEQSLLFGLVPLAPLVALVGVVLVGALSGLRAFAVCVVFAAFAGGFALPGRVLPRTGCDVTVEVDADTLVVLSHNVLISNTDDAAIESQIRSVDPDVIMLQEVGNTFADSLLVELAEQYPFMMHERNQALLSRWPLTDTEVEALSVPGAKPMLLATVESPFGEVRIANFHSDPPFRTALRENQERQFAYIAEELGSDNIDALVGDFNAPSSDKRYRALRASGFTDAHRVAGCGFGTTWSRFGPNGPAMLSLDHALLSESLVAETFEILDYAGSDHKAIAVRFSIAS